jgi:phospholipid/cholesterol/gamma-HCH transport system permease protein
MGLIGAFVNVRETTPIIAAIALAAQCGSSFTAELGAMRISEEIDALEVMGVHSFVYLICTRVVAALIALVPLYLLALFATFFATRFISTSFFHLAPGVYDYYFHLYLPPIDLLYSSIKVAVFAFAVITIHCFYGYYATGGPTGVGRAAGRAIRLSIITIVTLNMLLSYVFWGQGDTVRLAG